MGPPPRTSGSFREKCILGDVGSPDAWIWDLKTGEEAWVTAPRQGPIVRVALLPPRGDPDVLFQA